MKYVIFTLCILLSGFYGLMAPGCSRRVEGGGTFRKTIVDANGPRDPWGKSVGDIDGDGFPDLIVGGHRPPRPDLWRRILNKLHIRDYVWPDQGELVWYQSPSLERHLVSDQYRFRTDIEVADIDGDGKNDIVCVTDSGLVWFKNPLWTPTLIDTRVLHDLEIADLDGDGDLDIVARNQRLFGHNDADQIHFYRQESPFEWVHLPLATVQGEGLKIADMDSDGRPDVVVNSFWYRNPGHLRTPSAWFEMPYCSTWTWPDLFLDVADMNQDGRLDVVLAPAEPAGEFHHISWCEAPATRDGEWVEHVVDPRVESVVHSIAAGDLNNDGRLDIVTAAMVQGGDPDAVAVYWQSPQQDPWRKEIVSTTGSHSMRLLDFDQDGDLDFFGANWSGEYQPVELWENQAAQTQNAGNWSRHLIDADKPWRSVFVFSADLNGDGLKDILAGGAWYENPGKAQGAWKRHPLGKDANNVALVRDFDGDGDQDVLASTWNEPRKWTLYERVLRKLGVRSYYQTGSLVWAQNDGRGNFQVLRNVPSGKGDFLQGVAALGDEGEGEGETIILSWHRPGLGLQLLNSPADPVRDPWTIQDLSGLSQDEAVSAADLDGDGDLDLVLGTRWLRNDGHGAWTPLVLHETSAIPDRNRAVDLDGDGRIEVIIGYEAISTSGKLAWYHSTSDPSQPWTEHLIAELTGPMSVDAADLDGDGDLDLVVGEHNLIHPETARLLWFENLQGDASSWTPHLIHLGDEHHDGAHAVDIDNDGDMDVVSIGWGHDRLILYENQSVRTH